MTQSTNEDRPQEEVTTDSPNELDAHQGLEEFTQLARRIFDHCCSLTGATCGYVALLSKDGTENEVLFLEDGGLPCTVSPDLPMPIRGLRGEAYRLGKPVYDNDFANSHWMTLMPAGHVRLENVLFAPLNIEENTKGLLGLANKPGGFGDLDVRIVSAMGDVAATALNNTMLRRELDYERRRNEEILRKNRDTLKRIADTSPVGITLVDKQGRLTFANERACEIFGLEKEEACRRHFESPEWQISTWEGKPIEREALPFPTVRRTKQPVRGLSHAIKTPSGQRRLLSINASPLLDGDGGFDGMVSSIDDITESVRTKQSLEETDAQLKDREATLSAILDSSRDLIAMLDEDLTILWTNSQVETLYGKPLRGLPCFQAFHDRDQPCDGCLTRQTFSDGKHRIYEQELVFREESPSALSMSATVAARNPDGSPKHVVISGRDITELRRAELETKSLQAQLNHAQKMEAIGRLAGGIAHDFNNLLTGITGNVSLAKLEVEDHTSLTQSLDEIDDAAQRAAELTSQLLAFSRKQVIRPKLHDLNTILNDLGKMLRRIIGEEVELRLDLAQEPCLVRVDLHQIEQVILNLVVNARDAMPDGGAITLTTMPLEADSGCLRGHTDAKDALIALEVKDSGCGMDAETRERALEPFFTTKSEGKGTGLGLAMVYGVVRKHDGWLELESEPGRGTTIRVLLPRQETSEVSQQQQQKKDRYPRGCETILLAEDEPLVRRTAIQILTKLGYSVLPAKDGVDALQLARDYSGKIELLLTDIVMPRMNGITLAKELKQVRPEVKVIFTTGYTEQELSKHADFEECPKLIQKPYQIGVLAQEIRKSLQSSS